MRTSNWKSRGQIANRAAPFAWRFGRARGANPFRAEAVQEENREGNTMPITAALDLDEMLQQCIDHCTDCHALCVRTQVYCLDMGGAHAERLHQSALADCAQLCATCADFMVRQSPVHPAVCRACAEACERCALSCQRIGRDDPMMARCVDACRRCADSCQAMANPA